MVISRYRISKLRTEAFKVVGFFFFFHSIFQFKIGFLSTKTNRTTKTGFVALLWFFQRERERVEEDVLRGPLYLKKDLGLQKVIFQRERERERKRCNRKRVLSFVCL